MNQQDFNKKYQKIMDANLYILDYANNKRLFIKKEHELTKLYSELFDIIFPECVKYNIKTDKEFKNKFKNIKYFKLSQFLHDYIDQIYISCKYDDKYYTELKEAFIKVINQFKLPSEQEKEYKLTLAFVHAKLNNKKEAKKVINSVIDKYPDFIDAYDTLFTIELHDGNYDIEELIKLEQKADKNNVILGELYFYKILIKYYSSTKENRKKNKDKIERYNEILEQIYDTLDDEDDEYDEIFDDNNMKLDFLKDAFEELSHEFKDKVNKDKTYEQYLNGKKEADYVCYLTMYCIAQGKEKTKDIDKNKNKKGYILKNKEDVIKQIITNLKIEPFKVLRKFVKVGYKSLNLYHDVDELYEDFESYLILARLGLVFVEVKGENLLIHIPNDNIDLIKGYLNDDSIRKENIKINKLYAFFIGAVEIYGAIKMEELFKIYSEFFDKDQEKFVIYMQLTNMFEFKLLFFETSGKKHTMIVANSVLKENEALKIINANPLLDYARYPLKKFEKFSKKDYISHTNTYKKMNEELMEKFDVTIDMIAEFEELIRYYILSKRIKSKGGDKLLGAFKTDINNLIYDIDNSNEYEISKEFISIILDSIEKIYNELPNWEYKGKILNNK